VNLVLRQETINGHSELMTSGSPILTFQQQ
jgi:hypothetical protein